jgi:hypothetical protein
MRYVPLDRNRKDKTMKRIKNNDLTHYFLRDHSELPESYLKHCQEFFQEIGEKTLISRVEFYAKELQAASYKLQAFQAASNKRQAATCANKKKNYKLKS